MSDSFQNLSAALVLAQGAMQNVKAQEIGEAGNKSYRYADLAAVLAMSRRPLAENGLAVLQLPQADQETIRMTTLVIHGPSGEWLAWSLTLPMADSHPQAYGSLFTYARRYMLNGLLNIAAEQDDDGRNFSLSENRRGADRGSGSRRLNGKDAPGTAASSPNPPRPLETSEERGIQDRQSQLRTSGRRRRQDRNPLRALAGHLCRQFGARTPEEFSLLITTACDDPLLTWNVVRSRSDLFDQIVEQIERWRRDQGWEKEEVLGRLNDLRPFHFFRGISGEEDVPTETDSLEPGESPAAAEDQRRLAPPDAKVSTPADSDSNPNVPQPVASVGG